MYIMPFSPSSPVPPKIRPKSYPCPVAECTKLFTCERGIRDHLSLYKERFQDYAYKALEEQFAFCSDPPETKETETTPVKKAPRESGRESFNYLSAHYEAWKNKYGAADPAQSNKESFESRHRQAARKYRLNNKEKVRRMVKLSKFRAKAKKMGFGGDEAEANAQVWIAAWEKKYAESTTKCETGEEDEEEIDAITSMQPMRSMQSMSPMSPMPPIGPVQSMPS
ncbi:unnamed protein product [Tuber aestivum]|uniref:Uncharacterized protein n=2 Tax=Tuber TaxID=36048 RepID=A0A292QAI8_9PEZI|nr:unnamed protein product [Tuber aestivum]